MLTSTIITRKMQRKPETWRIFWRNILCMIVLNQRDWQEFKLLWHILLHFIVSSFLLIFLRPYKNRIYAVIRTLFQLLCYLKLAKCKSQQTITATDTKNRGTSKSQPQYTVYNSRQSATGNPHGNKLKWTKGWANMRRVGSGICTGESLFYFHTAKRIVLNISVIATEYMFTSRQQTTDSIA